MFDKKIVSDFPHISRARLKIVDPESSEVGDGKGSAPTLEEKKWFDLLKSTAPELEKLRKKLSVCAMAEVIEYAPDHVTFTYDSAKYTLNKPNNSLRIARARENSIITALEELNAQRCITSNGIPIQKDFTGIDADVIQIMANVAESFFFMPYL
jgi:hypothetical protein